MKKILLLILSFHLLTINSFAQIDSGNDMTSYTIPQSSSAPIFNLSDVKSSLSPEVIAFLSTKISSYKAYSIDYDSMNNYLLTNPYAIEYNLVSSDDNLLFTLQRRDMRSANFKQTETNENGETILTFERNDISDSAFIVRTLKGYVNRDRNKIARFVINENDLKGYIYDINSNSVQFYISLQDFIKESGSDLITSENPLLVFDISNLIYNVGGTCGVIDDYVSEGDSTAYRGYFEQCTPKIIEFALEEDIYWKSYYGSASEKKMIENLFFVEGLYTINFNVTFVINHINILNVDLYPNPDILEMPTLMQSYWNTHHSNIDRDLVLLYSNRPPATDTRGAAIPNSLCNNAAAYACVTQNNNDNLIQAVAHEIGHTVGSQHDQVYGYSCSSNYTIMCSFVYPPTNLYFSPISRNKILEFLDNHSACLNDFANGDPISKINKTWDNVLNPSWIGSWHLTDGDFRIVGNFDGENDDEEIFFASPDRNWIGIMDFSCDQGTDWYHLWANNGNRSFGTWIRNKNDKFLAGDFDGNGTDEVLTISSTGMWLAVQEYNASNWSWTHKYGNSGSFWLANWNLKSNDRFRVADYDGDGKDELLCVNSNGWSQLIKFNWNTGGYYVPQTIWSNNGNGWVGGVQIGNTNKWLSGKLTQLIKDELFTISGTWVTSQRFNGSGWDWMWSQYGANNFANMYILPLHNEQIVFTGNFDSDPQDEFVNLNTTWAASADYNGSTFVQNYNNGGTGKLSDWTLQTFPNSSNFKKEYLFVKAAPMSPKQILGIHSSYNCRRFLFFKNCSYSPTEVKMYKANSAIYNFKPGQSSKVEKVENGVMVYPNPASKSVNIEFSGKYETAIGIISDITGKVIKTVTITPSSSKLSIAGLVQGTYLLTVKLDNKNTLTTKFIINE